MNDLKLDATDAAYAVQNAAPKKQEASAARKSFSVDVISITYTPADIYAGLNVDDGFEGYDPWPMNQYITADEAEKLYAALGEVLGK